LIACAQTGTGKTGAFLIPILNKLSGRESKDIKCLVLVPTRELAKQIDEQVEGFAYFLNVTSIAVYGGGSGDIWDIQRNAIIEGVDIIIATPGRLIAHIAMGYVKLDKIEILVLDEADKMLDMGFNDDIMRIIKLIPAKRQTLMFSATMPPSIRQLANKILHHPEQISLAISKPAERIEQITYLVGDNNKIRLLEYLFNEKEIESMLVFTSRKSNVGEIVRALKKLRFNVDGINSDRTQEERENVLRDFKSRKINVLVATDVLSRGIDIENISHIINYDVPNDAEDYVHRVGRTARASSAGVAITFINEKEQYLIPRIESLIEKELLKLTLPREIGVSPPYDPLQKPKPAFKKGRGAPNHAGRTGGFQGKKRGK
ncbi:MAG: DEAD/DEAH box helicase, partial [Bacteroidia bacterium]|nr:DEAD/DEAH box helicase [Bacteroidia bacterium]